MADNSQGLGGAGGGAGGGGVDASVAVSEATTQGFNFTSGPFTVGGNSGTKWLPLALVALAALALFVLIKKRKH